MSVDAHQYQENATEVESRIQAACAAAGRPREAVSLIAVSKKQPASSILSAHAQGQRVFGENYVQEAEAKFGTLHERKIAPVELHLIGPLQSNKAHLAALVFDCIQTVSRSKIARALHAARKEEGLPPLPVFIQVDVSGDKSGVPPDGCIDLLQEIQTLTHLHYRGLMMIGSLTDCPEKIRSEFSFLQRLAQKLPTGEDTTALSMGMSGDYELAISEGATHVRVGSALFGAREA